MIFHESYGAKQYHMLGIHTQRAMLVFVLLGLPIYLLWWCTGFIFAIFMQDPEMSKQAGMYIRWLIPSIFPFGLLQCILKFLQTQNNISPVMISTGISSLVNVLLCWCFIFVFGLGNKGVLQGGNEKSWQPLFTGCSFCSYALPQCNFSGLQNPLWFGQCSKHKSVE